MKKLVLRITAFAAVIAAILLASHVYVTRIDRARLEAQLAALRAAGEPTSLEDLAREPIAPEKNAATFLQRALGDAEAAQKEWDAIFPEGYYLGGPLSKSQQEKAQTVFDAHANIVPLLEQAAACPDYDPQIDYNLPEQAFIDRCSERWGANRTAARVLRARTTLFLAKGRRDEALASMTLLFRLCRHFDHEPLAVGYLVSIACRGIAVEGANAVLQSGPVSKGSREALERELQLHDVVRAYVAALRSERAFALDAWRSTPSRQIWIRREIGFAAESRYVEIFGEYLETASRPYYELKPPEPAPERFLPFLRQGQAPADLARQSMHGVRKAMENDRARLRALRVLNALQVKSPPDAKAPPKLSDLGLPPDVTIDPFDGKPLRIKKVPNGWLIYSVGENLIDDGGDVESNKDVGIGPPRSESTAESK